MAGKLKDKVLTVSSFQGNIILCKGEGRGATLSEFYSHQINLLTLSGVKTLRFFNQ